MGQFVVDRANTELEPEEQKLADWAGTRPDDVLLIFATVFNPAGGEEWDTRYLAVEEKLPDGRIAAQWLDMPPGGFPETWEHMEMLAREGLARVVEAETK